MTETKSKAKPKKPAVKTVKKKTVASAAKAAPPIKTIPVVAEKQAAAVKLDAAAKKKPKADDYLYAVGRRKTAVAQVRVYKKGEGKITVNQRELKQYFPTLIYQTTVNSPLNIIGQADKLDVSAKVVGGGPVGQAEAIRHGISRALIQLNSNFRKPLKKAGFLTRDARKKERKKPGLKRARRAPQWTKR